MAKPFYQLSIIETSNVLGVNPKTGLSDEEITKRRAEFGSNTIERKKKINPFALFFEQFKDFLIRILIVAAVVSILLGETVDGVLILVIVLAVAIVGFLNEYKAEKTIEALKKLVALKAKVLRNGDETEVDSKDLVPGDIVVLEEGMKVPADIRLIQVFGLQANEASLTGESTPVFKKTEVIPGDAMIGDRKNLVFFGTNITSGRGLGVVVGTGEKTEIGQIAEMVEEAVDEATPMQKKLDQLGKQLGYGVLAICAIVFVIIFFLDKEYQSIELVKRLTFAFIVAVALAVAAIPEGLAFVVRISLALGARRMAKKNALIRRLPAVEALGSTDTICADKTGTLTKGEMTVRKIWVPGVTIDVSGTGYDSAGNFTTDGVKVSDVSLLELILKIGALCNNSNLHDSKILGDPTEAALLVSARKGGQDYTQLKQSFAKVNEVPFTSLRKLMTTVHIAGASKYFVATKGAAENVLNVCDRVLKGKDIVPLTEEYKKEILEQNHKFATEALRVLAFAYKETSSAPKSGDDTESGLVFVGLQGMMDPPRLEIIETIERITKDAGMKVIMITGDHVDTAKAVAKEIGLSGEAVTGLELDKLSQGEFEKIVETISVYARVNPEHKIRIVQALKKHGHQVAMTGDGVNDAPAIKAADIGIAMGITGTDVSKEAADVILLDDHFLTIVSAVEEGRGIYDNVRKFVNYLISCNISEVLLVLFGLLLFGDLVLTALQLLFINIVTDGLPAVALGSDSAEKGIMKYKPKRYQAKIIDKRLWVEMFVFGLLMAGAILFQFNINLKETGFEHAAAVAFTATVILELIRLINVRSDYKIGWFSNPWLIIAIISSFALQFIVNYTGFLSKEFHAGRVDLNDWTIILITSFVLFISMKVIKKILIRLIPEPA